MMRPHPALSHGERVASTGPIRLPLACALALLALSSPGIARADRSPGPLAQAHASLDTPDQCSACHTKGSELGNDKCLGCHEHEAIKRRMAERRGFHSSEKVGSRACYLCHTDHKGRGKDISGFVAVGGIARFDHNLTNWPLTGAHAGQVGKACEKCHTQRKGSTGTFLGASATCEGCHKSPHGDLRAPLKKCERCHGIRDWKPLGSMNFDHNNPADARFSLEGKHAGLPCSTCHVKAVYRGGGGGASGNTSTDDCTPCHKNPHGDTLFGKKRCATCHSEKVEWTAIKYDHAHVAKFPLDGAHAKIACTGACHPAGSKNKPQRACDSCHKNVHEDRFKATPDCGKCHSARKWVSDFRFDHKKDGKYALTGRHAEVTCRACHRGDTPAEFERFDTIVTKAGVACMSCHRHENVHKKQYKDEECLKCHLAAGKKQFKSSAVEGFHGEGSRFPLVEGHLTVACEPCHKNGAFQGTPTACGPACHADPHGGKLEGECERCHEGAHWPATRFDHDDSVFPLVGHHNETPCAACHSTKAYKPTPVRCTDCHTKDDAHGGKLGKACEQCHTPSGRSTFDHNDPAAPNRYRLDGKHLTVPCQGCHPTTEFTAAPRACEKCHGEPAQHQGQLGTRCAACHETGAWKRIHTRHDVGVFRFGGAHDRVPCATCHVAGRPLGGTSQLCIACHRGDDIHHNTLGPRCGECHGQQGWSGSQVRFFHERTGCDLRGIHRTLPCNDCHVGGNFTALSTQCVACHRAAAIRAAKEDPKAGGMAHAGYTQCALCHNANFFDPAPHPGGSESVCQ